MKVSIIGTVGVPANYGGFETLVDQLIKNNSSENLQYTVYCSSKAYKEERWVYHGARTEYIKLKANGIQSIIYDLASLVKAARNSDVILILGVSGCAFLPIFRWFSQKRLVINIDGLEHRRDKWNKYIRKFLKFSEKQAVKYGDVIVSDNKGIQEYVTNEYHKKSELIAYGGDHAIVKMPQAEQLDILHEYGLEHSCYDLAICRIEPENNVHVILDAYSKCIDKELVFIGNWGRSEYGINLRNKYQQGNMHLIDAVYDIRHLYSLRNNCRVYLHGHSAGGTNPSLVEAMSLGKAIIAFDCIYNRETTEYQALYFTSADDLRQILMNEQYSPSENIGVKMQQIAERRYRWSVIARQYESLYSDK